MLTNLHPDESCEQCDTRNYCEECYVKVCRAELLEVAQNLERAKLYDEGDFRKTVSYLLHDSDGERNSVRAERLEHIGLMGREIIKLIDQFVEEVGKETCVDIKGEQFAELCSS